MHRGIAGIRLVLATVFILLFCDGGEAGSASATNSFPGSAEIFQGRVFEDEFTRDVFFLRAVRDRYPSHWAPLLEANINAEEYVHSPVKLLRFIDELGAAMQGVDDLTASTNLVVVVSTEAFYTNNNNYHPELLRAATQALLSIGSSGRKELASSFTESHYCRDSESLEELANVIGHERPSDSQIADALAATAFDYSTTNGGIFARCTTVMVKNLLCLPDGVTLVRTRLKTEAAFHNPPRFQAVVDGIAAARATELVPNLTLLQTNVIARLSTLTNLPGIYKADLEELNAGIHRTITVLKQ
jgi:hypothetical protein